MTVINMGSASSKQKVTQPSGAPVRATRPPDFVAGAQKGVRKGMFYDSVGMSGPGYYAESKKEENARCKAQLEQWPIAGVASDGEAQETHTGEFVFYSSSEEHWSTNSTWQVARHVHPAFGVEWTSDSSRPPREVEVRCRAPHWSCCGQREEENTQCTRCSS